MYQLLRESPLQIGGGMIYPEFRRIRDGLRLSVDKIKTYRRMNPRYLPGGHILLRLLNSIPMNYRLPDDVFNDKVRDNALLFTQSLKFTSSLSRGQVWRPGAFHGGGIADIIIATTDEWDVESGVRDWENLAPIRYLYHPMSSLRMPIPDGSFRSTEEGIAVITVNVPMLAVQYRKWRTITAVVDESPRTIGQFLQAYPLPNMLDSQVDLAILNRIMNQFFAVEAEEQTYKHPFYLIDWTQDVDRVLEKWLLHAAPKRWDFDTLVSQMPTVCSENLHHVLKLPDQAFSVQIQWAVALARLQLAAFLVQFNQKTENHRNNSYLNYLRRWIRYMDTNTALRSALPRDMYEDTIILINHGIDPFLYSSDRLNLT